LNIYRSDLFIAFSQKEFKKCYICIKFSLSNEFSLNGGVNTTFTGLTGSINQALWNALAEGNVVIRFYANDSAGNMGFAEVTIRKDVSVPIILFILCQ